MASKFDALALNTDRPFRVFLKWPDGKDTPIVDKDGKPAFIDVYSTDSVKANRLSYDAQDNAAEERANGKKLGAEELDRRGAVRLAALTVDWYLVGRDGNPLGIPCTQEEAEALYLDPRCAFIREQALFGAGSRANFMPAPQSA